MTTSEPSTPATVAKDSRPERADKLSVSLVKRQESSLLSEPQNPTDAPDSCVVILRLGWKLRVHGYLAKFVATCGAVAFALEAIGGSFMAPSSPSRSRLASGLRSAHSPEWVGFAMVCAGLVNLWVKNGRVSLLIAYWANIAGMVLAALGLGISCLLLALYFRLKDADATQELLNASLLALFVLLAQLSGLLALVAHTLGYHPYRIFAIANRLRTDSAGISSDATAVTIELDSA